MISRQTSKYNLFKAKEEMVSLLPGVEELESDDPLIQQADEEGNKFKLMPKIYILY